MQYRDYVECFAHFAQSSSLQGTVHQRSDLCPWCKCRKSRKQATYTACGCSDMYGGDSTNARSVTRNDNAQFMLYCMSVITVNHICFSCTAPSDVCLWHRFFIALDHITTDLDIGLEQRELKWYPLRIFRITKEKYRGSVRVLAVWLLLSRESISEECMISCHERQSWSKYVIY